MRDPTLHPIPFNDHTIIYDLSCLQADQRIDDLESGSRQVSAVAETTQVMNRELACTIVHQCKTSLDLVFDKEFFQSLINSYIIAGTGK
ncbi:hypothetical protein D3C83_103020 [compost metagenome]